MQVVNIHWAFVYNAIEVQVGISILRKMLFLGKNDEHTLLIFDDGKGISVSSGAMLRNINP